MIYRVVPVTTTVYEVRNMATKASVLTLNSRTDADEAARRLNTYHTHSIASKGTTQQ